MPADIVLPCRTLPELAPRGATEPLRSVAARRVKEEVERRVAAHGTVYVPLFSHHHWIAGVLSRTSMTERMTLEVWDSAPSWPVHRDIQRRLKRIWPDLKLVFRPCQRQARGSEDCGVFMTANFFLHHLGLKAVQSATLPSRLRPLLYAASTNPPSRDVFLRQLRDALQLQSPPSTPAPHTATPPPGPGSLLTRNDTVEPALEGGADDELDGEYDACEPSARAGGYGYMLTALALARRADGEYRSLTVGAVRERVRRTFPQGTGRRTVSGALEKLGLSVLYYGESDGQAQPRVLADEEEWQRRAYLVLERAGPGTVLPAAVEQFGFVAGAEYHADEVSRTRLRGHYTVTRDPAAAEVGVYLPRPGARSGLPDRRFGAPGNRPVGAAQAEVDPQSEMEAARRTGLEGTLNGEGRYRGACACPREWYIHSGKPPQVSQVAWTAMSREVRDQHRTWLHNLRAMPADLLSLPLHSAAIELVRRMGCARHWKWSTMSRHYATIQAALLQLPLYTNQVTPVDLSAEPEWRYATAGARRFERESVPEPPAPLTEPEYERVRRSLRDNPEAQTYAALMWACAARAGDIGHLLVRDVHLGEAIPPAGVRLQLTIRRGKGARFRGPYPIPTVLPREEASILQGFLGQRAPNSHLFPEEAPLRTRVVAAIKAVNSSAALPSLRKGAARHLAAHGVPEESLMRVTGHTRVDTLRRYLGYGLQATAEDVAVQDVVNAALRVPSSSAESLPTPGI